MITRERIAEEIKAGLAIGMGPEQIAAGIMLMLTPEEMMAASHPLRVQIMRQLQAGPNSPSVVADRLSLPLGNVSYHFRKLARLGLVRQTATRPRRGAVEHFYELVA